MSRFLTLIPYLAAQKILKNSPKPGYQVRTVPVRKSHGHLNHEPVFSRLTIPHSAVSQRDGYAIISADTQDATESHPIKLDSCELVHTGSPIPDTYDAVVMHEEVRIDDQGLISILKPARPGQHIQKAGSEMVAGKMIIPASHRITPEDIGAMVGYGIISVQVRTFVAGLIPTGDELKEPCTAPGPGEVVASNCSLIAACLEELGIESIEYPIVPDDPEKIQDTIEQAVRECTFIIISGGSSTGKRDHTHDVISKMGSVLYHGVAMRPGKTTLAGIVEEILVFGVPGTPAGALSVLRELIIPWISDVGYPVPIKDTFQATLADSVPSQLGTDDFIQMVVGRVHTQYRAVMVPRGGGQMSGVKANGILHIARNSEGIVQGKECLIRLTRIFPHPDNVLLFSGIYDPILDILDQFFRTREMSIYIRNSSPNATLLNMQNKHYHGGIIVSPHIEGIHLRSPDFTFLKEKVYAIHVADREYILAARVFPESETLTGYNCPSLPEDSLLGHLMEGYFQKHAVHNMLINRLNPICIREEEIIHRIRSGEIDFGPCSRQMALECDLFGPLIGGESIDLIIRDEDIDTEQILLIRELLSSEEWKDAASIIPGYNLKRSGHVRNFVGNSHLGA